MAATLIIFTLLFKTPIIMTHNSYPSKLYVKKCTDFSLTGTGDNPLWQQSDWVPMSLLDESDLEYETRFKMLYSDKGIYVLGFCEDKLISTDYKVDQGDIWNGDVFEVFLQTDETNPLYFEYEINPHGAELAILVPNNEGDFYGWSPWHYEGDRKVNKTVRIHRVKGEPEEKITGWSVEFFIPFELFNGLKNSPPKSGTQWKGNIYRIDYDTGELVKWGWNSIDKSFHEYKKFGTIIFE